MNKSSVLHISFWPKKFRRYMKADDASRSNSISSTRNSQSTLCLKHHQHQDQQKCSATLCSHGPDRGSRCFTGSRWFKTEIKRKRKNFLDQNYKKTLKTNFLDFPKKARLQGKPAPCAVQLPRPCLQLCDTNSRNPGDRSEPHMAQAAKA